MEFCRTDTVVVRSPEVQDTEEVQVTPSIAIIQAGTVSVADGGGAHLPATQDVPATQEGVTVVEASRLALL